MNSNKNLFSQWMIDNTKLSSASTNKYAGAVDVISREMQSQNVIVKKLYDMSLSEYDIALKSILKDPYFIKKDTTGNKMYSNALKHYRCHLANSISAIEIAQDIEEIEKDNSITKTDKDVLVKARIGQGKFKTELIKKYSGECIVTGIKEPRVLIASHIKPWAVSNNVERISKDNGLLLSATIDKLFDCGLISFKDDGHMLISSRVYKSSISILKLDKSITYNIKANQVLCNNLEYHRDVVFIK